MENMQFKPCKAVLVFWLIWITCGSLPVAGGIAGICFDSEISPLIASSIGTFVIWSIFSLYAALYFYSINYVPDNRYITKSCGVIWKKRRSIPFEKITNIDVRQGPFERLLGFGQIWIFTPSTGALTPEGKLIGISVPYDIKEIIIKRSEKSADINNPPDSAPFNTDMNKCLLENIKASLLRIEELLKNSNKNV